MRLRSAGVPVQVNRGRYAPMNWSPEQQFVVRANPLEWRQYAEELMGVARELMKVEPSTFTVTGDPIRGHVVRRPHARAALLLAAFAVENLVKGLAVALNPSLVSNGVLSKNLKTHAIRKIADQFTTVKLSAEERRICEMLETCIPSWGRYPIPTNVTQVNDPEEPSDEMSDLIEALYERLSAELEGAVENGWTGPHDMKMGATEQLSVEEFVRQLKEQPPGNS